MSGESTTLAVTMPIGFAPEKIRFIRALNLILICLIIGFSSHEPLVFPFTPIAILGFIFVRGRAAFMSYLTFVTALGLLFFPHFEEVYLRIRAPLVIASALHARSIPFTPLAIIGARLFSVCVCLGMFRMLWQYFLYPLRMIAIFSFLLIAVMLATRNSLAGFLPAPVIWCALTAVLSRTFLAALLLRNCDPRGGFSWRNMVFIAPFFQYDLAIWDQSRLLRPAVENVDQLRYLRKIILIALVFIAIRLLRWFLFQAPTHQFFDLHKWGYLRLVTGESSQLEGWLNFLFHPLYFATTSLWAYCNSLCIMFGVIGYPMSHNFDEPWKAKSFSDFMSRMFHYYSRFVTNLLFIPLLQKTRFLRPLRPFDQLIVLFISIFLFSMIYHLSREYWITFTPQLSIASIYFKNYLLYSTILGLSICLSVALERASRWRRLSPGFRLPIYFLVYAVIYHFGAFQTESIEIKWLALKTLFGGGFVN